MAKKSRGRGRGGGSSKLATDRATPVVSGASCSLIMMKIMFKNL